MNKYRNKKVTRNGVTYDSRKEADRHVVLKMLERAGKITNLQRQVKFVLIPAQYEPDTIGKRGGVKRGKLIERECAYIADFVYKIPYHRQHRNEDGHIVFADGYDTVVEDTKGFRTKDYIIKRKLMLHVHGIKIKEI